MFVEQGKVRAIDRMLAETGTETSFAGTNDRVCGLASAGLLAGGGSYSVAIITSASRPWAGILPANISKRTRDVDKPLGNSKK